MITPNANKSNFRTVQVPSGVMDLHSLLLFMDDKARYSKYLKELTSLIDEANASIEKVGKAKEIEALLATAAEKEAKMANLESEAREKATNIVGEAEKKARNLLNDASERSDELLIEAETHLSNSKNRISDLDAKESRLNKREKELVSRETSLESRLEDVSAREAEIKRKAAVLAQL